MSKNKNNKPIWNTRIKKYPSNLFKKIGGSLSIDKRYWHPKMQKSKFQCNDTIYIELICFLMHTQVKLLSGIENLLFS